MHVDCNAVRLGAQKGRSWALASCRKLARAWIPLANVIEDNTDLVTWLPAHCGKTAIGSRVLSNGRLFDEVDHVTNDLVDKWAKSEARASAPCKVDFEVVNDATRLVEDLARWIGICTREANHYPAPGCVERATYIRDTSARKKGIRPSLLPKTGEQVKRKPPLLEVSFLFPQCQIYWTKVGCMLLVMMLIVVRMLGTVFPRLNGPGCPLSK